MNATNSIVGEAFKEGRFATADGPRIQSLSYGRGLLLGSNGQVEARIKADNAPSNGSCQLRSTACGGRRVSLTLERE